MHEAAIRVGLSDWREWLLSVADTRTLRRLELPGELLESASGEALRRIGHLRLAVLHVADALPATLSRYASEAGLTDDGNAMTALLRGVRDRLCGGVRLTSVDVGLDRLRDEDFDTGLRRRAHLLRRLIHDLEPLGVAVAVRVCMPRPFAGSHEWEWAGNLLHELSDERCGLAVDVAMPDLPETFDPDTLLRDCSSHLALLRLHFRWGWGESPAEAEWQRWAGALRRHAGPLGIVFCPREVPLNCAAPLLGDVERWASLLTGAAPPRPLTTPGAGRATGHPPARSPG